MQFNEAQIQAIQHNKGPCMVIAGPGSGKTAVLTNRVRYLIDKQNVRPSDILVITFTRAAAVQMKSRFMELGGNNGAAVSFGTFHSVFFTILKTAYNYSAACIIKQSAQREFVRDQMCRLELEYDDESEAVDNVLSEISRVKGDSVSLSAYESMCIPPESFRIIYRAYDDFLIKKRFIDFDDMIIQCRELLSQRDDYRNAWQDRYKYILVDEFQDINMAQFDVLRILSEKYRNLFVVGDDDQSIYGFRGASPDIMLNFDRYYNDVKRIALSVNYRSTGNIVLVARSVIEENEHRYGKNITTAGSQGEAVSIYEFNNLNDEKTFLSEKIKELNAQGIDYNDIAVLSRTNVVGDMYRSRIEADGIVCSNSTGKPDIYEHWIAKDILAYIRIASGSRGRAEFLRIINKPMRYITRSYLGNPVDTTRLKVMYAGNSDMLERLDKFMEDINLIKNMSPFAAVNYIRKGIGYDNYIDDYIYEHKTNREALYNVFDELLHGASKYRSLQEWIGNIGKESIKDDCEVQDESRGVHFLTMHCSKGLEYKVVFVVDVCEGVIPYNKAVQDYQIEEERRLFYVAMTRAKEKLYLLYPKQRYNKDTTRSRFIEEILTARYPLLRTALHTP